MRRPQLPNGPKRKIDIPKVPDADAPKRQISGSVERAPKVAWREYVQWELRRQYRYGKVQFDTRLADFACPNAYDHFARERNLERAALQPQSRDLPPVPVWTVEDDAA